MHTLHKRTYLIYTNAYTYTPPQTYIYTHIQTKLHTNSHLNTYKHMHIHKQTKKLCTITNTDIPTHTHDLTKEY